MPDFNKSYNQKIFCEFLSKFLPDDCKFVYKELKIESGFNYFINAKLLASVDTLNNLKIIEIEHSVSEKKRITIARDLFRFLSSFAYSNALVITYSKQEQNYRFSFVTSSLDWVTEKKVKRAFSNPKRLSFLLGGDSKLHTPYNQLKEKIVNFSDLKNRFDIEVVNDEFFDNYKKLFLDLKEKLDNDKIFSSFLKRKKLSSDFFSKRLLGQIVFCYFLQKKGWLGVAENKKFGSGDQSFIRNQFTQYQKANKNFFNDFLEFFFYEGLNNQNENNYLKKIKSKIPYIGGDLFEYYEGYDWKKETLGIPNSFFSNDEQIGILDTFDLYNFTVDENADFDIDIAVDPEMLGKTFERLLNIKDRKSSGSFYTPREIVKFMNEDALTSYLSKNLYNDVKYKDLEIFVKSGSAEELYKFTKIRNNADKIDKLLKNITVCDPSVGTGAFVVEMLNLISNTRKKLDLFLNKNRDKYYFKLRAIQKSIYGVDIDKTTVEIAKLRLWLSLIIDEKNYENISALPNLDFKFMVGNSLNKSSQANLFDFEIFKEIEKLKESYLLTLSYKKKRELTKEINILYSKLNDNTEGFDYKVYFSEIFENQKGFDIIIGNPPYIRGDSEKSESEINKDEALYKKQYHDVHYGGRTNVFVYFIRKSFDICKKNGLISLIINNKWMTANYGKKLRNFLCQKKINKLINFGDLPIFEEAAAYPSILVIDNNLIERDNHKARIFDAEECIKKELESNDESVSYKNIKKYLSNLESYFRLNSQIVNSFPSDGLSWSVRSTLNSSIFVSARKKLKFKFSDKKIPIRRGIVSAANQVYIIDKNSRNEWIKSDANCKKYLKPYLKGRNIIPWKHNKIDEYIIYADRNFEITKVPKIIRNHLEKNKELLSDRTTVPKSHSWYQLQQPQMGYVDDFENKKKVVWRDMSNRSVATIVEKGVYLDATCFYIPINDKALCTWMHSDFFINYLKTITSSIKGETFRWIKQSVEQAYFYPEKMKKNLEKIYNLSINNSDISTSELNKLVNEFLEN